MCTHGVRFLTEGVLRWCVPPVGKKLRPRVAKKVHPVCTHGADFLATVEYMMLVLLLEGQALRGGTPLMLPGSAGAPWVAATGRIQPRPRRNLPSSPSLSSFERLACGMCWGSGSSFGEEHIMARGVASGPSNIAKQDIKG